MSDGGKNKGEELRGLSALENATNKIGAAQTSKIVQTAVEAGGPIRDAQGKITGVQNPSEMKQTFQQGLQNAYLQKAEGERAGGGQQTPSVNGDDGKQT